MARRRSTVATPLAGVSLALHDAAARAQLLLRERARLLRDVQRKKLQLVQVREKAAQDAREAVTRVAPLLQRHQRLLRELTQIFDELLSDGRLSARARRELGRLRGSLELRGVLPPLGDEDDESRHEPDDADFARGRGSRNHSDGPAPSQPRVAGAPQVGQTRRTLRELFRSLARVMHPDQARHEADREKRTQLMKEATRAYEEGDLARLLELETAWQNERAVAETADSLARCRELERVNRELLKQVRELTRELRDAKREAREEARGLLPAELIEQATSELDALQQICDWVQRFRDGKLTLNELLERCY
jgi:chemotaxis regulatin CheY-phosphate phosphatase CheZ